MSSLARLVLLALVLAIGCGDDGRIVSGGPRDGALADAGGLGDGGARGDLGSSDAGSGVDAASGDAGDSGTEDLGAGDLGAGDSGTADLGPADLGGVPDMGPPDLGPPDMGPPDMGPPDMGPPSGGCISGAVGTHVARFRWNGSSSGSTAWLSYEANTLPDTSRWRAGAYSRGPIGYRPVWADPFLGEGGLDMTGTVFMDVELSTASLSSIRNVTIALYGRSFSTGSSGSFSWMTFDGSGATPSNFVSNVAPYQWYRADATLAFRPGNAGVLLRIEPGPSSNRLVVNRVEICFDAS